jgi:hypothetical protein
MISAQHYKLINFLILFMKKIVKNKENFDYEDQPQQRGHRGGNSKDIKYVSSSNKRRRVVDSNTKNLRRLYNKLMQKDEKKAINKVDIVDKIIKLVNGNYGEFCYKHDGCRVLQGSIKYGSKKQKQELISNLKPFMFELVNKKYSIFLAIKIYKFAENKEKESIVETSLLPNFNKLLKLANGQLFLNYVFANSPNNIKKRFINYYIAKVVKISEKDLQTLGSHENTVKLDPCDPANDVIIVEKQGTYKQENVRDAFKNHLEKQLEKGVHKVYIFQAFLNQIFNYMDSKTKVYVSELFDDDINEFLNDHHGVQLACKLFNVSQAKTRKKTVKKLKDNISMILSNEVSLLFLIKIILFCDDTKLVQKHILTTLIEKMNEEFMQNKGLLKVFMNIIVPFNPRCNKQDEQKILQDNQDSSSKKDLSKRRDELVSFVLDSLMNNVNLNMKFFISDQTYSTFVVDLVNYLDEKEEYKSHLETMLGNVIDVLKIDQKSNYDDLQSTILADKIGHFTINKILGVFLKKNHLEEPRFKFIKDLSALLLTDIVGYLETKAVFIIVKIVENEATQKLLHKEVAKHKNTILEKAKEKELIGYQLLAKIIK